MITNVVLVHPEIHWNTGNAGRSCLAAGAQLHLIQPLGFSMDDRYLKRAGLDYWEHVEPRIWTGWDDFERTVDRSSVFFFSTKAERLYWEVDYSGNTTLIFGRETGGLPNELHERYADRFVRIPICAPEVRSLNLSTAVGIALYEVLRQRRIASAR